MPIVVQLSDVGFAAFTAISATGVDGLLHFDEQLANLLFTAEPAVNVHSQQYANAPANGVLISAIASDVYPFIADTQDQLVAVRSCACVSRIALMTGAAQAMRLQTFDPPGYGERALHVLLL